ncbi:MAG: hypothetical protein LYZ70_07890 [Nitrososphaerales archaeon]|nr:hypothetical protein [Nitrososphaerales archaeon]
MPKRSKREAITAVIALQMLIQGGYFDSHGLSGLPFNRTLTTRALRALVGSGVIARSAPKRKYLFTDEFMGMMKQEVTRGMSRGIFVHYPDFGAFDVSGMEDWTEDELEVYVQKLREHWLMRTTAKHGGRSS